MRWCSLFLALCLLSGLRAGDPIRVAVEGWSTLNPLLLTGERDAEVIDLIFDRLVTVDATGKFIPELLESWVVLDGGRTVILKLRPGLTWHDGHPIEAEDVVFTWKTLRLPQVRKISDSIEGVTSLDSLEVEGPLTVRIRVKRPRGTLLTDLYNFIPVPRHCYQVGAKPLDAAVNSQPVGSGPYRVVGRSTAKQILLERWNGYRGIHPGLAAAFELLDQRGEKDPLGAFQQERVHFGNVDPLHYYLVRKGALGSGFVQGISLPLTGFDALFLNCDPKLSLLGDLALRQAIYELIPLQDLARAGRFFPTHLAANIWPAGTWANDEDPRPLPKVARAIAILNAAGWKPGPDGIRQDAKGRRLELVAYQRTNARTQSVAKPLAAQAARVGVRIEVRTVPFDELLEKAGNHDGDIWNFAWTLAQDPDVDSSLFTKDGYLTKGNYSSYLNPSVDRLFDLGRHTLAVKDRKRIYSEISDIIFHDKPIIPINYSQSRLLTHRRLQGVSFSHLGQSYGFWPGRRGWRLAD